jgi:hypothetical protein
MNGFRDRQDQLNQSVRAFSGNPALVDRERRLAGLRGVDLTCRGPRGWGKHVSGGVTIVWWAQVGVSVAAGELVPRWPAVPGWRSLARLASRRRQAVIRPCASG